MTFTINGEKWTIKFVRPNSNMLQRSDGSFTVGVTDRDTSCVYLSDLLYGDFLERVLCHELCHVVCMSWNIIIPIETEEKLCNFMADHGKEIIYLLDDLMQNIMKGVA